MKGIDKGVFDEIDYVIFLHKPKHTNSSNFKLTQDRPPSNYGGPYGIYEGSLLN